ncbi:CDP-diacylglycerol--glycerol-3-phosphate 3-phosphatidyltransferase [Hasllibacter sp. MH4015]|uniref:CDP-diacylglycerol--glycerol-3-phosphate 3-phosphatidyltransferase n=1 Tax=Hasllibacter sp. MH4015 TaxID=2854029 RepID=UPI001CD4A7C7|nr:CDP-diacylglycerol--glycerol-3-phosphate 3-phosphatidyltransferase [Hasllibacter sp. MH4015]
MRLNLPNSLTLVRLVAAPMVAFVFILLPRPFADWVALLLFMSAAFTDYVDGVLARAWKQETKFGAMLDPIADKAMVVIALTVVLALYGVTISAGSLSLNPVFLIPIIVILLREIFVSGLREFLGANASKLKVTKLAKWKTTVQMFAIGLLFCWGLFAHYLWALTIGMDAALIDGIMAGEVEDEFNLRWILFGYQWSELLGIALLWLSAALTAITGIDYFRKARPYLTEPE